jgi:hypothetical protein
VVLSKDYLGFELGFYALSPRSGLNSACTRIIERQSIGRIEHGNLKVDVDLTRAMQRTRLAMKSIEGPTASQFLDEVTDPGEINYVSERGYLILFSVEASDRVGQQHPTYQDQRGNII